tara:strand:+ start:403 stop:1044 length:642 start_codon:yes stop_codon:yes gene_type:complete
MKGLWIILCGLGCLTGAAQTTFKEKAEITAQKQVSINFPFTDEIEIKIWDKQEVYLQANVTINEGADDGMFAIKKSISGSKIDFSMDNERWNAHAKKRDNWTSDIFITIYLPSTMEVSAKTISGNIITTYFDQPLALKTISGNIDLTIDANKGLDFRAKTISGDVYSDIEISFPQGKDGLRKMVGMDVAGRIRHGGKKSSFETISGSVFLRKG